MLYSEIMFFVQQDGYRLKSIYGYLFIKFKENILNIFMCLMIIFCMLLLDIESIYFILPYVLIQTSLWLWAGNQFEYIHRLKYTKRLIRQISLFIIFLLISVVVVLSFNHYYIVVFFPFIFVYVYLLIGLDLILLQPIEKLIGKYYLSKAKNKLKSNNKIIKIGITGSYGKTSTKEILKSILSEEYYVLSTPKSYNTPFGISKTINEEMQNSHQVFVCEMGAKKNGEIKELCNLIDVDYGIVTSVGRQHLETFGNIENIYKTKRDLPDYLYNKHCVFNLMNYYVAQMYKEYLYDKIGIFILQKRLGCVKTIKKIFSKKNCKKRNKLIVFNRKYFEFVKNGNLYVKNLKISFKSSQFDVYYGKDFVCCADTELIGIHNVINILLSVAMAKMLGVGAKSIVLGIQKVKSIKARFEKMENKNGAIVINNGYNSNLDSAVYSLKALSLFEDKKKLVVTPGLIECKNMYEDNYKFGKMIGRYANEVIVVKKTNREAIIEGLHNTGFKKSKIYVVDDFSSAKQVIEKLPSDYVVLIENDLPDKYL